MSRLLVFGGSGRTGRLFVAEALAAGHEVDAFVRDPDRLGESTDVPGLAVLSGDVTHPADVAPAVASARPDVVVSLIAPRHERDELLYSVGTAAIIAAMDGAGIKRLIAVSAEGVRVARGELPLGYQAVMLYPGLGGIYDDIGLMEDEVMASDLDWTLVRPAVLTDGAATGQYRVVEGDTVPGGMRVSRADVSAFLLRIVETGEFRCAKVALAM